MGLNDSQKVRLIAAAKAEGMDEAEIMAAAEKIASGEDDGKPDEPDADAPANSDKGELPKLFQYHLPFVKVKELRARWLGLTESVPDEDMLCAEFALKHGGVPANSGGTDDGSGQ
jgi:hypothetical protein